MLLCHIVNIPSITSNIVYLLEPYYRNITKTPQIPNCTLQSKNESILGFQFIMQATFFILNQPKQIPKWNVFGTFFIALKKRVSETLFKWRERRADLRTDDTKLVRIASRWSKQQLCCYCGTLGAWSKSKTGEKSRVVKKQKKNPLRVLL